VGHRLELETMCLKKRKLKFTVQKEIVPGTKVHFRDFVTRPKGGGKVKYDCDGVGLTQNEGTEVHTV
jgi:hypothetical protein